MDSRISYKEALNTKSAKPREVSIDDQLIVEKTSKSLVLLKADEIRENNEC